SSVARRTPSFFVGRCRVRPLVYSVRNPSLLRLAPIHESLMSNEKTHRNACVLVVLLFGSAFAAPSRADRPPLPDGDQMPLNQAIDAGPTCLLVMQGPRGTWRTPTGQHVVGYAALPGLTLLECGVPADAPAVQRAARFVRLAAPRLDTTYE